MPDLDDIFEEIFDAAKKFRKKQKRKAEKSKDWEKKNRGKKDRDKKDREKKDRDRKDLYAKDRGKTDSVEKKPSMMDRLFSAMSAPPASANKQPAPPQSINLSTSSQQTDTPVQSAILREYITQASLYEQGILELMRNAPTEINRSRMEDLSRYIEHWRHSLESLIERVEQFQQNELLQRDLKKVPKAIERLQAQLEEGAPEMVAQELQRTLNNRQNQLASLTKLKETMQWAEVKIENTVSMLGTIYSQATMSQSKGQVGNYQRLLAEIEEESLSLDDYVTTLKEIKFGMG